MVSGSSSVVCVIMQMVAEFGFPSVVYSLDDAIITLVILLDLGVLLGLAAFCCWS
jgi:hypothetical protein